MALVDVKITSLRDDLGYNWFAGVHADGYASGHGEMRNISNEAGRQYAIERAIEDFVKRNATYRVEHRVVGLPDQEDP